MAEKNSRRNETTDALFDAILSLESREECYAFFEDLCTVTISRINRCIQYGSGGYRDTIEKVRAQAEKQ